MKKPKIGIIGIGMVGTPVKMWFEKRKKYTRGKNLFCFDKFIKGYSDDVSRADIVFICLPTPSLKDGSCNISIVESAIAKLPDNGKRDIVIKSTLPPGTTRRFSVKHKSKGNFFFNPEFLKESSWWYDFVYPDRQIVAPAEITESSLQKAESILKLLPDAPFMRPLLLFEGKDGQAFMTATEAELGKNMANFYLATEVVLYNILFDRCGLMGADFEKAKKILTNDKRIGEYGSEVSHNLYRGFGGACFTKDTNSVLAFDRKLLKGIKNCRVIDKLILEAMILFDECMILYNKNLLASQGLTSEDVSKHDDELKKKLESERRKDE